MAVTATKMPPTSGTLAASILRRVGFALDSLLRLSCCDGVDSCHAEVVVRGQIVYALPSLALQGLVLFSNQLVPRGPFSFQEQFSLLPCSHWFRLQIFA
jgi:hypothetical protein